MEFKINMSCRLLAFSSTVLILTVMAFSQVPARAGLSSRPEILPLTDHDRAWIREHPVVRLAPDPEFKPIEFFDSKGGYTGMAADYVRLIEKKTGLRFQVVHCRNWDEVIEKAKNRDVDVLNAVVKSPQREKYLIFPTPYLKIPSVIIVRNNVNRDLTIKLLKGMHVVMVSGYGYLDLIKNANPGLQVETVEDLRTALRKVSFGMADAFIGDLATASYYIESEGISNLKVAGETEPPNISGFAVRSDWPELSGILEKAVASLSDEEKKTISKKWIQLGMEPAITVVEFRNLMLLVIGFIIVLTLGFMIWTRTLRRAVQSRTEELRAEVEERRRAEEALSQSGAQLRSLLNTLPDLIWFKDQNGVYLFCNLKFERFIDRKEKEIIGKTDYDFFDRETAAFFRRHDQAAVEAGRPTMNEEVVTYADDGHQEMLETIKTPVFGPSGKLIGVLGIARDITERKLAEDERQKLLNQLYQARKIDAIGRLAGGVAHDFNNMLAVIIGRSELARMDLDPSSPLFKDLLDIEEVGKRSADLTRQLLAFARKQTISPQVLNLNETIENTLKMLKRLIGEGVDIRWNPSSPIWPVKMDPVQIDQLLANLIINARDSFAGNMGQVTIVTKNQRVDLLSDETEKGVPPGNYVYLEVTDNGCGMDARTLENIFEPFFTTKEQGKGTGLGLSTIYGIVKQNDGFILVESEPGKGTSFKIYLPRSEEQTGTGRTASVERHSKGGRETILLVEDEPAILHVNRTMLDNLGYNVLHFSKPSEALEILKTYDGDVHLLMTDVVMPEINGRELSRQVAEKFPDIKVLFMSGYTADVIAHHGVLDEDIDFIQKPFTLKDLASKVREILDR